MNHVDVIIVGAGLSGIGAARRLQDHCPQKTFLILEARSSIGGTWDLFRYPGIRSDSDMYTMGYDTKPWQDAKAIADGPSILNYVNEAARERGFDQKIRFQRKVVAADFSDSDARWTVSTSCGDTGDSEVFTCNFLFVCSGYYNYEQGYQADIAGIENFSGDVVHPQFWPEDLDYSNKRVVIIGSGATAMTLVPSMAKTAASVTMLQRSPTYVVSMPAEDKLANWLKKLLPAQMAYQLIRWKNIQFQRYVYGQSRKNPEKMKQQLLTMVRKQLGDEFDVEKHFTPSYNPWDQRLCLVPDADLFKAMRTGKADVVTDEIADINGNVISLKSGAQLEADVLVTATGLEVQLLGGAEFSHNGEAVNFPQTYTYKGMMFSGVPNLVYTLGYINASWTLRSELVAEYVCRLINHLDECGADYCKPALRQSDQNMPTALPLNDFTPGYIMRAIDKFPKQGDRDPWCNRQNYMLDKALIRKAPIDDGALEFAKATHAAASEPEVSDTRTAA